MVEIPNYKFIIADFPELFDISLLWTLLQVVAFQCLFDILPSPQLGFDLGSLPWKRSCNLLPLCHSGVFWSPPCC